MSQRSKQPSPVPRGRRTFTAEFRAEAVHLMRTRRAEGCSLAQIGRELDIRPSLLWHWARRLDGGGTGRLEERPGSAGSAGSAGAESLEDEVRRLRRENTRLRQEREFAKKAAAFFAMESR